MVHIIEKDLFKSDANFLVHQCNCEGFMGSGVAKQVADLFPHVKKEYLRYINHCNKNNIRLLDTIQFVPTESWAIVMVDTIKNNRVEVYDNNYQYIVNLFGQEEIGTGLQTDIKAVENGLIELKNMIQKLEPVPSVAIPYGMSSVRGGANWKDIYKIIEKIFGNTNIDVQICKCNKG